ncbi:hypothetical protein Nepgr_017971 [Nepenthes gracilis]|uniref:Reverse transcriptase/retrotransposon-derived protein RNase H-like domain-containing protein n=1 Tax=Nepenthes gracilis TaxID=150966 RepID=A0AAD3SQF1_NEPGR|nr:hypothetical protein Nepgr_017971 [Nepenthes gracilis]
MKHYGTIHEALTKLMKKHTFCWTEVATHASDRLKEVISAPTVSLPDFSLPFILKSDACAKDMGAVLLQKNQSLVYLAKLVDYQFMRTNCWQFCVQAGCGSIIPIPRQSVYHPNRSSKP